MRTLRAKVTEQLTETTFIEVEVPDDVDLADQATTTHLLERAFVDGAFRSVDGTSRTHIHDRGFTLVQGAQHAQSIHL